MANANPEEIDWAARTSKRRNDSLLDGFMMPLLLGRKHEIDVLSMPATHWLWERFMSEMHPEKEFHFYGVEKHPSIWKKQEKSARHLNTDPAYNACFVTTDKPTDWSAVMEESPMSFDIIYADYMGAWSRHRIYDIDTMFRRRLLNLQGYFIVTLSLSRDGRSNIARELALEYGKGIHDICVIDDMAECRENRGMGKDGSVVQRAVGIPRIVQDIAQIHGQEVQILPPHIYYNKQARNLGPEVSLCFRRIK